MFGCYRRDGANDPEVYTTAITAVLSEFSQDVVEYVTDPRTGIAGEIQWLPSVAEVKAACMKRREYLDRQADFDRRFAGRKPIYSLIENRARGRRANVFVHAVAPQYQRIYDWTQSDKADPLDWKYDEEGRAGVWVSLYVYDRIMAGAIGLEATEKAADKTSKLLADDWATIGESAPTVAGVAVSRELVETMQRGEE